MDRIKDSVRIVLPNISENVLNEVVNKLDADGVSSVEDLEYVQAEDLAGLIRPIEIRKLLKSWSIIGQRTEPMIPVSSDMRPVAGTSSQDASIMDRSQDRLLANQDPCWPHSMEIPWADLPEDVANPLNNGSRLVGPARKKLIHTLIFAVHRICKRPLRRQLAVLARRVHETYPNAIVDKLNGVVIGSGYENFIKQLTCRSENQNRQINPLKRTAVETNEQHHQEEAITKLKRDSYGCINWQPGAAEEELQRQAEKRDAMKLLSVETDVFPEKDVMETYPLQRKNINSGRFDMNQLVEEWPFLFTENGMLLHFKLLTGIDLNDKVTEAMRSKSSRIYLYSRKGVRVSKMQTHCKEILAELEQAKQVMGSNKAAIFAVVKLLMANLSEKEEELFKIVDEHTASTDFNQRNLPVNKSTPCLVACGDSLLLAKRFMLAVDNTVVLHNIDSALSALCMLFAAYYCLNLEYPEGAAATLEFIQRCFVGICPDEGSKAARAKNKKVSPMNPKVFSLVNTLADFEWTQNGMD